MQCREFSSNVFKNCIFSTYIFKNQCSDAKQLVYIVYSYRTVQSSTNGSVQGVKNACFKIKTVLLLTTVGDRHLVQVQVKKLTK